MDLSRPLSDHHEICTQVRCGVKAENLLSKIFLPPLKIWHRKKLKFSRTAVSQKHITSKQLSKCQMFHLW